MDADNELAKAKWLLIGLGMLLVSGCVTYGEIAYLVNGRTATADITKAYESTRRGRFGVSGGTSLTVEYAFAEPDGTRRKGMAEHLPLDWTPPSGNKLAVRYTPGENGNSRLDGRPNWVGLGFFGLSLAAVGWFGFRLWREASEATRERPKGKK